LGEPIRHAAAPGGRKKAGIVHAGATPRPPARLFRAV
jgi:hypothetical protein